MPRKRRPRDAAEARERLKQFATNLRDVLAKPDEIPLNSDLATWVADAVDAYTLERQTKRKRRARSMDVALGLEPPAGRPRGTQTGRLRTAIHIHYLSVWGETWDGIADRYQRDVRSLQRICKANEEGVMEHLMKEFGIKPRRGPNT